MSTALPAPPLDADAFKCTCTEWWGHPAVQLLVGDALRPGGAELTARLLDGLELAPGSRSLDVGSGAGVTLEVMSDRGLLAFGVDYGSALADQAARYRPTSVGDGESLPFASGSFDLVTMECVLSALPDKPAIYIFVDAKGQMRGGPSPSFDAATQVTNVDALKKRRYFVWVRYRPLNSALPGIIRSACAL